LSKEYLESINKASSTLDSHMLEIRQRALGSPDTERHVFPDDASSVTGSSVSEDFVIVSSGDIVKRKSKSAKKIDKARNSELQMQSLEDVYDDYAFEEDFGGDLKLSGKSKEKDQWAEPRRHFGLRTSKDYSQDLQWREPKVFVTDGE
jgi:hypothetical protein